MNAIVSLSKSAAAMSAVALALIFTAVPASAMNGDQFTRACAKKSNCVPDGGGTGGYIVHGDGSFTVVTCDKTNCTTHKDRKFKFDKTLGHGATPAQGQVSSRTKETQVKVAPKLFVVHPQVSAQKPPAVPKVSAPVGNPGKSVKVNAVR